MIFSPILPMVFLSFLVGSLCFSIDERFFPFPPNRPLINFKLANQNMVVNKKEPPGDVGGSLWQKGMKEDFYLIESSL